MGGEIHIQSKSGKGSEFTFTAWLRAGQGTKKKPLIPTEDLKNIPILIIDDNRTSRQILEEMLRSFAFKVDQASSGEKGLALIRQAAKEQPYRLILMDWKMPGLDGIATSTKIREMETLSEQPKIILVTVYAQDEAMEQVKRTGLDGLLFKPVSPSSLFDAIMQVFGKAEHRQMVRSDKENREAEMARPIQGARILLVEDNEINQQIASEILTAAGLRVSIANNGLEAVDAVQHRKFDALLMDIQMPVMDGYEATREIRNLRIQKMNAEGQVSPQKNGISIHTPTIIQHPASNLPIIAMTASAMVQDREEALKSGMNDHLSKPINVDELFSVLRKWIKPRENITTDIADNAQTSRPKTEKDDIPEIDGIDTQTGLMRVGGNKKLYRQILIKFSKGYKQTAVQIINAIEQKDKELARRLAHTVKGVSGNIGAEDLQKTADEIEVAIKDDKIDEVRTLIPAFERKLNGVLKALEVALFENALSDQGDIVGPKAEARQGSKEKFFSLLDKLEPNLEKGRPKPCKEVMTEIASFTWPGELSVSIATLEKHLNSYKFKDALKLIATLKDKNS